MDIDLHVNFVTRHLMESLKESNPPECQEKYLNTSNICFMVHDYVSQHGGRGYVYEGPQERPVAGVLYEMRDGPFGNYFCIKYYFCDPAHRRRGHVSRLIMRVINAAICNGVNYITACIQDRNTPSISLANKFGFAVMANHYTKTVCDDGHAKEDVSEIDCFTEAAAHRMHKMLNEYASMVAKKTSEAECLRITYGRMLRKAICRQENFILLYKGNGPDLHSFALCEAVTSSFRDYLQIHYLKVDDGKYDFAIAELCATACSRNIPELGMAVPIGDTSIQRELVYNGFELCDRTYLLSCVSAMSKKRGVSARSTIHNYVLCL